MRWHDPRGMSSELIGRAGDLQTLLTLAATARGGHGQTGLVAGEAGAGKSRLVAELRGCLERDGFRVCEGQCFELDLALPYAPVLDLLRAEFADLSPEQVGMALGEAGPVLAPLLPELSGLRPVEPPAPRLDPAQEKQRLAHALVRLFASWSQQQPLLLVFEDVHWADGASLEFLFYLARHLTGSPVLLILTYRDEDRSPDLEQVLAELNRGRLATELALAPLTAREVGELVERGFELDRPPSAEFVHALHALSDGNPYFIEEVLAALVAERAIVDVEGRWERRLLANLRIPHTIAEAVRRRTDLLSPAARQVLDLAAVAGRRFDFTLLQALTGRAEADLVQVLKELVAARLVVELSAEEFAFHHALTRQAVYLQLLARERAMLHRTITETLVRQPAAAADHAGELAYHSFAAGLWPEAAAHAQRAGEQARALDAPRAAVEHFGRAVAALAALGEPPSFTLLRERGLAHDTLGEFAAAASDFAAALAQATADGDRRAEWQALLDLGLLWSARDYQQALGFIQRALDLARQMGDPALVAQSLNRLGNWYANQDQPVAAETYHQEAREIFTQLGDTAGLAATLDLLGMTRFLGGDLAGGAEASREAATHFQTLGDRQRLVGAMMAAVPPTGIFEMNTMVGVCEVSESLRTLTEAVGIARDIGWRSGESFALALLGESYGAAGEFGRGLDALTESLMIAEDIDHPQWIIQANFGLGGLFADLLAWPEALAHLERAQALAQAVGSAVMSRSVSGGLASVLLAAGRIEAAGAVLDAALAPEMPMVTQGERMLWAAAAELALARGDAAGARRIVDSLYDAAANLTTEGDIPRLALLKARALITLGEDEPAARLLRSALAKAREVGVRPMLWPLHAALAGFARRQGRLQDAAGEIAAGDAVIRELAATVPDAARREAFLAAALDCLAAEAGTRPRRRPGGASGGLTTRELDVARLIVEGRTNREIAAALFVSERTVESHTSNILRRLGFSSRAQIAAWVAALPPDQRGT